MVQCSNSLIGILNFLTFIFSIPILYAGLWLRINGSNDCERWLNLPVIVLGLFLLIVSFIGLIGSCSRVTSLLWVYLFLMFLVIIVAFGFIIFTFVVSNKGASESYGDYTGWLQKKVNRTETWNTIKTCMQSSKMCSIYKYKHLVELMEKSYSKEFLMVQNGCCKPPNDCNFSNQSPVWIKPSNTNYTNPDCDAWNNNPNTMCYNCESCKNGFLQKLKTDLTIIGVGSVVLFFFLSTVFSIGCCALDNNRRKKYRRY